MYLSFEQVVADASVDTVAELTIPSGATHAEIQADTQDVRYTMDDSTAPTQTLGMIFDATNPTVPKSFVIDDIRRIRYTRGAGSDGNLNIHYFGGRNDL